MTFKKDDPDYRLAQAVVAGKSITNSSLVPIVAAAIRKVRKEEREKTLSYAEEKYSKALSYYATSGTKKGTP